MDNTCNFETCVFRKKLKLKTPWECPNYIETQWVDKEHKTHTTKDCAPKRMSVSINEILARILTLQKSDEKSRDAGIEVFRALSDAINVIQDNKDARLQLKINDIPSLPDVKS